MKIYACGGTGLNIGNKFEDLRGDRGSILSSFDITYIDTSDSNSKFLKDISPHHYFRISDVNGSGKKRDENYAVIREHVKSIILKHPPEKFNIIVHSGSGGSGSVIGPVLTSELLKMDVVVVVIMVGSSDSVIEARNTIKTFASYESISKKAEKPVPLIYHENSAITKRITVDEHIRSEIFILSAIFSGKNQELDDTDIYNFFNYNRVTSSPPMLVAIENYTNGVSLPDTCQPISCLTIAKEGQDTDLDVMVEYKTDGYLPAGAEETDFAHILPIHYLVVDGLIFNMIRGLEKKIEDAAKIQSAKVVKKPTHNFNTEDDGLVL